MASNSRDKDVFADVSGLLSPSSVAVVGASDRPGNLGGDTVARLLKFAFPGPVWPVNPRQQTVRGMKCYSSPRDLPDAPGLVIFAVAADALVESIVECADVGARNGIAYAGGFAEAGAAGAEMHRALVEVCSRTKFKLCGPNCVGIINTNVPVTATFATALHGLDSLLPGAISMVSQSGGIGTSAFGLARQAGFGFRYLISSGNEAVVDFADYLHFLAMDDGTRVIAGYLEGVRDGHKLLLALREARERRKTVILMKAGTTGASASAAQAHTGALAGADRVYDAVFREMGVIRVYSLEELVETAMMASGIEENKLPKSSGVGIVTFGGGNGVIGADQCAQSGLTTPALTEAAVERLRQCLVPVASAANPMDLTPSTAMRPEWLARLPEALDVVLSEESIDTLMLIVGTLAGQANEILDVICDLADRAHKPLAVSWAMGPRVVADRLAAKAVYSFPEQAHAIRAIGQLVRHQADLRRPPRVERTDLPDFDWSARVHQPHSGAVISENQCHEILAAAGLSVAAGRLAGSEAEAVEAAQAIRLPVALKGVSPAVTHRAAAGLLAVDLRTLGEVRKAFRRLNARARVLGIALDGVYVQHMVEGGTELLVSAFRDSLFGPMVAVGAGGNLTEIMDDVVLERAPVDEALARDMLGRLRIMRQARRPESKLDPHAAARFIAQFSRLAATAPWREFVLEVNPIKWTAGGVVAVDGLLIVEEP